MVSYNPPESVKQDSLIEDHELHWSGSEEQNTW